MTPIKDWKLVALKVISEYERGLIPDLTVKTLASMAGVSRTTLWRDADVRERLDCARKVVEASGGISPKRSSLEERIVRLQLQLSNVEKERDNLIRLIASIYVRLSEEGVDPSSILCDKYASDSALHDFVKAIEIVIEKGAC